MNIELEVASVADGSFETKKGEKIVRTRLGCQDRGPLPRMTKGCNVEVDGKHDSFNHLLGKVIIASVIDVEMFAGNVRFKAEKVVEKK